MNKLVTLDTESYPNMWLFACKSLDTGKVIKVESFGKDSALYALDINIIKSVMFTRTTFGFNSLNYDLPMITYALMGKSCYELYKLSTDIIENNKRSWQVEKEYNLQIDRRTNHFDIMEPSPGVRVGLKLYGARLHSKKLQDLPIESGTHLTREQSNNINTYCDNDLNTNIDLYHNVEDRIKLRFDMSKKYGINLRSKSDAQTAEAIIKYELEKITKSRIYKPKISEDTTYRYKAPDYIKFKSKELNNLLDFMQSHNFELDKKGSIKLPKELSANKIEIGNSKYKIGIGGLHSSEKSQTIIPNSNEILIDRDVEAFYPNIILSLGLYPKMLGKKFLNVYKNLVDERMTAKHKCKELGYKHKDFESYNIINKVNKIVINGSFGKLGSKYSILYAPDLMLKVTLTGQLVLLMLIERLEDVGIIIKSANTDGFVSLMNKEQYELYNSICFDWELDTKFVLEETNYKALYSRDINNYLAITTDNEIKGKGIFTLNQLTKNPSGDIIIEAVINLLTKNIPIEKTIKECKNIKKFLVVRSVTGGAVWKETYLGKVVRWIYSTEGETIHYKKNIVFSIQCIDGKIKYVRETSEIENKCEWQTHNTQSMFNNIKESMGTKAKSKYKPLAWAYEDNDINGRIIFRQRGNKVPRSDGGYPAMSLIDLPDHIDYDRYVFETDSILKDLEL